MQLKDWMYDKSGSHPTRGEWIEIFLYLLFLERGLSLTPHGVSGLKSVAPICWPLETWSHPTRGEWIEIEDGYMPVKVRDLSHPTRGEWIEIKLIKPLKKAKISLTPHGVSGLKWNHVAKA